MRTRVPDQNASPHEVATTAAAEPPPMAALAASVGNQGIARMATTAAPASPFATQLPVGVGSSSVLARQPIPNAAAHPGADDLRIADPAGRDRLEKEAHSRVNQAFTAFQLAALGHQESLKAEAKAEAEVYAAVIDVLTGFAAPAFANWAGGRLAARAAERMTDAASKAKVAQLITTSDKLKASFTGASKVATTAIKMNSSALFGEGDADQFARSLRVAFHAGAQALTDSIGGMNDEQLLGVWGAYDEAYTNENVYREALKKLFEQFKSFVRPIGHKDISPGGPEALGENILEDRKAVYMDAYGEKRLALIRVTTTKGVFTSGSETTFDRWVPSDIAPWVVEKSARKFGSVPTIDPKEIHGHVPAP